MDIPYDSISRLVEYSWNDEDLDFEAMLEAGEVLPDDENHIYTHLKRIAAWLDATYAAERTTCAPQQQP